MIITEIVTINGRQFTRNYSNEGRYVVRDGISYEEAYDPIEFGRTYIEGDLMPIEEPSVEDMAEAGRIMMAYEYNDQSENTESED